MHLSKLILGGTPGNPRDSDRAYITIQGILTTAILSDITLTYKDRNIDHCGGF